MFPELQLSGGGGIICKKGESGVLSELTGNKKQVFSDLF